MNKFQITPAVVNKNTEANAFFEEIGTTSPNVYYKTYITEKRRAPAPSTVLPPPTLFSAGKSPHQQQQSIPPNLEGFYTLQSRFD